MSRSATAHLHLVVLCCLLSGCRRGEGDARVQSELRELWMASAMYWARTGQFPTNSNTGLYSLLTSSDPSKRLLPQKARWDMAMQVVDPWGTPYAVFVEAPSLSNTLTTPLLRILSCGPNRLFEHGLGDDLEYSNTLNSSQNSP